MTVRIILAAAMSSLGLSVAVGKDPFQTIPADHPTFMAISEDGRNLLLANEQKDVVSVWDTATGKVLKQHKCPAPGQILCRGEKAFVVNRKMGTITVLSQKQGFKPVDQLEVGDEDIIGLSAPTRKDFADELLVTCHRKRLDFKDTKVYLVNVVKDRYKLVLQTNWFDPMYSDAQGHFAHDWHFAYDYNQLRAGNPRRSATPCR